VLVSKELRHAPTLTVISITAPALFYLPGWSHGVFRLASRASAAKSKPSADDGAKRALAFKNRQQRLSEIGSIPTWAKHFQAQHQAVPEKQLLTNVF
jgi:hypothetical protein